MLGSFRKNVAWGFATMSLALGFTGSAYVLDAEQKAHATTLEFIYLIYAHSIGANGACSTIDQAGKACDRQFVLTSASSGSRTIPANCATSTSAAIAITTHYDTNYNKAGARNMRLTAGTEVTGGQPGTKLQLSSTNSTHVDRTSLCCIDDSDGGLWGDGAYTASDSCSADADAAETSALAKKMRVTRHKGDWG